MDTELVCPPWEVRLPIPPRRPSARASVSLGILGWRAKSSSAEMQGRFVISSTAPASIVRELALVLLRVVAVGTAIQGQSAQPRRKLAQPIAKQNPAADVSMVSVRQSATGAAPTASVEMAHVCAKTASKGRGVLKSHALSRASTVFATGKPEHAFATQGSSLHRTANGRCASMHVTVTVFVRSMGYCPIMACACASEGGEGASANEYPVHGDVGTTVRLLSGVTVRLIDCQCGHCLISRTDVV